ncbi:non-homologous end-joining DNA ligase [Phenylobacterium sp. LjRoot164]|uniref:non-homologous end-joining DNA ligase n=1 Tax=unclassified Phenylobacterium TaxID=2640670 RepID=UPI003ECC3FEB
MAREGKGRSQQYVAPTMPRVFLPFQHPKLVATPPAGEKWSHEIKFDGYRVQLHVHGGTPTIFTRNGHDWTAKFPELAADLGELPDCILDGELCALDGEGRPNFSKLRASISPGRTKSLVVFLFDIIWGRGEDMRSYPLSTRRYVLEEVLGVSESTRLREVSSLPTGGPAILASACKMGLEGIVSKRLDAPYGAGRSDTWVKAKCRPSQEVVIGGWKQEPGRAFKGLLVGVYDRGRLTYAGSIKTGFSADTGMLKRLRALETEASPFAAGAPRKTSEIHWVRPELVAAAEIAEWTDSGKLRQASFKGLREDKAPEEVVREK